MHFVYLWYNMAMNWTNRRTAKDSKNIKLSGSTYKHKKTKRCSPELYFSESAMHTPLLTFRYSPDSVPFGKYFGILILITSFPMACRKKVATTHSTLIIKYRKTAYGEKQFIVF